MVDDNICACGLYPPSYQCYTCRISLCCFCKPFHSLRHTIANAFVNITAAVTEKLEELLLTFSDLLTSAKMVEFRGQYYSKVSYIQEKLLPHLPPDLSYYFAGLLSRHAPPAVTCPAKTMAQLKENTKRMQELLRNLKRNYQKRWRESTCCWDARV